MTVGKPTPNNLTINNLIESQTMGVSGEPHKPFGRYENVFLTEAEYDRTDKQSSRTDWNGSSRK